MKKLILPFICLLFAGLPDRAQSQARLVRGPYLQAATSTSMVVRWRTTTLVRSRVRYGTEKDKLMTAVDDSALTTEHLVKLTGLKPDTRYYYAIGSLYDTLQIGGDNYFKTLPLPGQEGVYRIGAFGDCGNNSPNQRNVRDAFIRYLGPNYLNAWILLGDNAYSDGTDAEFQAKFFDVYQDNLLRKYPLFPAPGNHDYNDIEDSGTSKPYDVAYYQNFTMPVHGEAGGLASGNPAFYSYDIGNVHFLSLDSYGKEQNKYRLYDTLSQQVQWMKNDLEANKNKQWVVAYWHHPPYTMGSHNSDKEDELARIRENFVPILERYGVDLVICGHSHDHERSKLMAGHAGKEGTFDAGRNNLSSSTAAYNGSPNSCPYIKSAKDNKGTVYVVSGSAGALGGIQPSFPHEAMPFSDATNGGATIIEVQGNRLDVKWICGDGQIRDSFTMMKDVNKHTSISAKAGQSVTLMASFNGSYRWSNGSTSKRIVVIPRKGTTRYVVKDAETCLEDTFVVTVK